MSTSPKISVIVPSFNQGKYIGETLESICSQSWRHREIIVMDGGSTDETVSVLEKFAPHLTYWESRKDNGQSEAINKGFRMATGDIFAWLNSDDRYTNNALKTIASLYSDKKSAFIGKHRTFRGEHTSTPEGKIVHETAEKTAGSAGMSQPAMFFAASAYREIGLLNEQLHYCMDLEWWIRYLLQFGLKGVVTCDEIIAEFRLHETSKTENAQALFLAERNSIFHALAILCGDERSAGFIRENEKLMKDYSFGSLLSEQMKNSTRLIVHYHLMQRGDECYAAGEKQKASSYFSAIDTTLFPKTDRDHLKGLVLRNKLVPSFIKRLRK